MIAEHATIEDRNEYSQDSDNDQIPPRLVGCETHESQKYQETKSTCPGEHESKVFAQFVNHSTFQSQMECNEKNRERHGIKEKQPIQKIIHREISDSETQRKRDTYPTRITNVKTSYDFI
jgi:hypothetical protein